MSDLTFTGLKYAQVLGKPLSKSLYRQLPTRPEHTLVTRPEDLGTIAWSVTVYGKINWCPPGCEVETHCECEGKCQRHYGCSRKRVHQHLLVGGDQQELAQSYVYLRCEEYDEYAMSKAVWEAYEPRDKERRTLKAHLKALPPLSWDDPERKSRQEQRTGYEARVAVLDRELKHLEYRAMNEWQGWIQQAVEALPVILLR